MSRKPQVFTVFVLIGAFVGVFFASFSTHDFAQHLDRQVHSINCSFIPGLTGPEAGPSGCQTTMMSAYSSLFRQHVWGGLPIALPAMSVFAFLFLFAIELCLSRRQDDPRATGFLALATALPAGTSMIMATISIGKLDAVCKLCMGIYLASAVCVFGAIVMWRRAVARHHLGTDDTILLTQKKDVHADPAWTGASPAPAAVVAPRKSGGLAAVSPTSYRYLAAVFGIGVAMVAVPAAAYVASAPDHARFVGACGSLEQPKDAYGVFVPFGAHAGGVPTIELFDPLCPACRAFEKRLEASGLADQLDRKAALFPLDSTCNWMVSEEIHPGACAISEAVLCAGDHADAVVAWAFDDQEHIRDAAKGHPEAARELARQRFPELATCIGSHEVQARLNEALRWSVKNHIPVLTPQVYLGGVKLCDEDVDLGLDFALSKMIDRARAGTLGKGATP